jgi:CubicO group peptidase (beta-lactamase class C family)
VTLRRTTCAVVLALAALASAADSAASSPAVDRFIERAWPDGAGGTVVVARGGELVTCKGFGAATCDTVYDVMSMTKQFTAAAILKLESQGRLRVTDPIARFLGPVPEDKRAITVHHLLTHTAGLVEALGDDYERVSRDELVGRALGSRLRSAPGSRYHYSNAGYSLLAAIVEQASGLPYERYLAKHLFEPAKMTQTGYVLPRWRRSRVAVEYDRRGVAHGRPFDHPWADDGPYWNLRGNGGMLSTARDMLRWHRALRGERILSRAAKRELFRPHVPETADGASHYGYGWVIVRSRRTGRIAWHDGGNGWSFGVVSRLLDRDVMVFWIGNRAYARGRWNLERLEPKLTLGIADRVTRRAR